MYKSALLLLFALPVVVEGFTVVPQGRTVRSLLTPLHESMVEVKRPDEAEWVRVRGAREWPQQVKQGKWSETVDSGKLVARYILDGRGSVAVTLYTNDGASKNKEPVYHELVPGSFLEAMGPATLEWEADDQILLLTPGYEQGSLFAAVAALFVVLCGALITGSFGQ